MELDIATVLDKYKRKLGDLMGQITVLELQIEMLQEQLEAKEQITAEVTETGPKTNGRTPKAEATSVE